MNVLFLVSDDLRPQLGMYNGPSAPSSVHPPMHTPALDALSRRSLLLKRAYVQEALCSPSRTSFLTGRRPDTTHVYDLTHYFRHVGGNFTTIPQYFKMYGYRTIGVGKIFHSGRASGYDDPISWTDPYFRPKQTLHFKDVKSWRAVPLSEWSRKPLRDTLIANHGIETLRKVASKARSGEQPFFLAVGLRKPHLPFEFPDKFLSYYPKDSVKLPTNPYAPKDMPPIAWSPYGELMHYSDIGALNVTGAIATTLPNDVVLDLRRAYYSAVSYMDNEMGRVIAELETLGLANNTIVSFLGDHGWQLGEHGEWCKHTNFEIANHAPMMIHVPGLTDRGIVTEQLTEFVDLFPTLVDAAGLPPLPFCPIDSEDIATCTEGLSLVPLMKNRKGHWKSAVFSQYPREHFRIMGYSIRTHRYRYTEWAKFHGKPVYKPDWGTLYGVELYDHKNDPAENMNLVNDPQHAATRHHLSQRLRAGWRAEVQGLK
ncbi:iduronate 2-sulfatase-like [Gigantopelta aegis]|uniref:iduronate 2-sulfatase-like n=1 Tax=Gigantopelta aegis TaxID=1735272 RepID=UPI001B888304|nr:iduronate 2-sulfatase-like [Gigantopelta aegis]